MKLNTVKIEELLSQRGWSEYYLSRKLKLDYSYVWRVLRGKRGIGRKFIGGLMKLCEKQGWDFRDFIIEEGGESDESRH